MSDTQGTSHGFHVSAGDAVEALAQLDRSAPFRSVPLFRHGSLLVKYYAPQASDRQQPHVQDEVYVIASGSAVFFDGWRRAQCNAGDLLFAAAGVEHRFEDFTPDFGTWVMFYGPEGGEVD